MIRIIISILCGAAIAVSASAAGNIRSHRGNPFQWNDHCLGSWQVMARYTPGVGTIEMDIRLSSDGVPVVIHDATVDAKTNGTGTVVSKSLDQLQSLTLDEWVNPAAQIIPSLAEALAFWKPYRVHLMIEEKVPCAAAIAAAVAATGFPLDRLSILLFESGGTVAQYKATTLRQVPIWLVSGGTPTSLGSATLAARRQSGYAGLSFENFAWTSGDRTLMSAAGLLIGSDERFSGAELYTQLETRLNAGHELLLTDDAQARVVGLDDVWWASYATAQSLGTAISTMTEDADADGLTNLEEMMFGTNPNSETARPTPNGYTIQYSGTGTQRRAIATARPVAQAWNFTWFRPEWSADGATWVAVPGASYTENNTAWPRDQAWKFEINLGAVAATYQVRLTPMLFPRP